MHGKQIAIYADLPEAAQVWAHALSQRGIRATVVDLHKVNPESSDLKQCDVIIVDDMHDPERSLVTCRAICVQTEQPLLLFSYEHSERFQLRAYDAGVAECVTKPIGNALFVAKVTAWIRHAPAKSERLRELQVAGFGLDSVRRVLTLPAGRSIKLSALEFRLLYHLMVNIDQVVESNVLVSHVWTGYHEADSLPLKTLVFRLRQKIEIIPNQPEYIQTMGKVGYRFHAQEMRH